MKFKHLKWYSAAFTVIANMILFHAFGMTVTLAINAVVILYDQNKELWFQEVYGEEKNN